MTGKAKKSTASQAAATGEMFGISKSGGKESKGTSPDVGSLINATKQFEDLETPEEYKEYIAQMAAELARVQSEKEQLEKVFGPTFHLFLKLPREIQLNVWRLACNVERVVVINHHDSILLCSHVPLSGAPAILHACRDSRNEGLKVYEGIYGINYRGKVWINFSTDIIYAHEYAFRDYGSKYSTFASPNIFSKLRKFAVDCHVYMEDSSKVIGFFQKFPNIEWLILVKNKTQKDDPNCPKETKLVELEDNEIVYQADDNDEPSFDEAEHTGSSLWNSYSYSALMCEDEEEGLKFPQCRVEGLVIGTDDQRRARLAEHIDFIEFMHIEDKNGELYQNSEDSDDLERESDEHDEESVTNEINKEIDESNPKAISGAEEQPSMDNVETKEETAAA